MHKYSDDGEPSGTAGLPVLEVLKANEVVNAAIVVTRYFGGILLGRGGLVRAYGGAAREALTTAGIVRMVPAQEAAITVDYVHGGRVQNELLSRNVSLSGIEYLERITFRVLLMPGEREALRQLIQEITANAFTWQDGREVYRAIPLKAEK